VITIQPSEDYSLAIHCILQTISIQDGQSTVPYDAISYFRGSSATTEKIVVYDGPPTYQLDQHSFEVPVTHSLAAVLRQLRVEATELEKPLILWTDAVCIHQLDAAERSQQVTIMRRIYEDATSVLVWLGEGDPIAEMGLVNLVGIAMFRQANDADRDFELDAFYYDEFNAKTDLESLKRVDAVLSGNFDSKFNAVEDMGADVTSWVQTVSAILDVHYWYRSWTLQEACANRHVVLQYGQTRCRVKAIVFFGSLFRDMRGIHFTLMKWGMSSLFRFIRWTELMDQVKQGAVQLLKRIPPLEEVGQIIITDMLAYDLLRLASTPKQTADPRDQVHSQLSFSPGFVFLRITPDYTMTTEQVFIATTIAILLTGKSWSHTHFSSPSGSPFLPSWAIDFTYAPDAGGLNHRFHGTQYAAKFSADGVATFRLQQSRLGSLLTAGYIYDDVVVAMPPSQSRPVRLSTSGVSSSDLKKIESTLRETVRLRHWKTSERLSLGPHAWELLMEPDSALNMSSLVDTVFTVDILVNTSYLARVDRLKMLKCR
jgi:hypothetical protein